MSVVVLGSINVDLTTYVPRLPSPGETLFGRSFITVLGGKGANQAVATGRLGAETRFFGRVGADTFGTEARSSLREEVKRVDGLLVDDEHATGLAVISVDDNAENAIIVVSGANMALDESDVERCLPALDEARVMLLQLEIPLETSMLAARTASERGVTVVLDPAPARELPVDLYPLLDIITPNEVEAEMLLGFPVATPDDAARAASELRSRGVATAIVKLGSRGAYYDTGGESGLVPTFRVEPVDTVAAGDAFNGGLAVALSEGLPLPEAVRWGAAAGALATTQPGASPSMPRRQELDRLLKEGTTR